MDTQRRSDLTATPLTQSVIAEAMARAEKVACLPRDDRCYPFPDPPDRAPGDLYPERAPQDRGHLKGHRV
jgi:hypothetical protein